MRQFTVNRPVTLENIEIIYSKLEPIYCKTVLFGPPCWLKSNQLHDMINVEIISRFFPQWKLSPRSAVLVCVRLWDACSVKLRFTRLFILRQ